MSYTEQFVMVAGVWCPHIDANLYNGPLSANQAKDMGLGREGCPHRGSTLCYVCPCEPIMECDYNCAKCPERPICNCGHDQTERLKAWEIIAS